VRIFHPVFHLSNHYFCSIQSRYRLIEQLLLFRTFFLKTILQVFARMPGEPRDFSPRTFHFHVCGGCV
jgi:hypothetical protein